MSGPACSTYTEESACELAELCYWADWRDTPRCDEIPDNDIDCICTKGSEGCTYFGPASGCEPTRFCSYQSLRCRVMRAPPEADDDCVQDGSTSETCVPSEYCETGPDPPVNGAIFSNGDCVAKANTTAFPTRAPTPKPTGAPTVAPTPDPDSAAGSGDTALIAGGAAGVALVAFVLLLFVRSRRRRGKALPTLGVTSWRNSDSGAGGGSGIFSARSSDPTAVPTRNVFSTAIRGHKSALGVQDNVDDYADGDEMSSFPDSMPARSVAGDSVPEF